MSECHNHVTRDIKPFGVCPACDRYYVCTCRNGPRVYPYVRPAHDVSCWYPARTARRQRTTTDRDTEEQR